MISVAVHGFEEAVHRYEAVRAASHQPHQSFVPLAEALWWAISADEGFQTTMTDWGYQVRRDAHHAGQVIRALRYARNRVGHQRALVIRTIHHSGYQQDPDGGWYRTYRQDAEGRWYRTYEHDFYWRSLDELPEPDPRHSDVVGKNAYKQLLEGKSAERTLDDCHTWLTLARSELPLCQP